jgi:predicted nucleic acid-binding protein
LTDAEPVLLDTDTLSELSRGNTRVCERALAYLSRFGRLTITAITVFERLRGYRLAICNGRPYQRQLQSFQTLVGSSDVLPFDESAAGVAGEIWSRVSANRRCQQKGRSLAGPPFGLGARDSYWQATAVLSGPGPTVPLVLP